MSKQSEWL